NGLLVGDGMFAGHSSEWPMYLNGEPSQFVTGGSGSGGRGFPLKSNTCAKLCVSRILGVRYDSPQLSAMNFSGDENSPCASSMYPFLAYGEITSVGTRNPSPMGRSE